jgi:hypothetical protein
VPWQRPQVAELPTLPRPTYRLGRGLKAPVTVAANLARVRVAWSGPDSGSRWPLTTGQTRAPPRKFPRCEAPIVGRF